MGRPLFWWASCILIFKVHKNEASIVYYRTKLGCFLELKLFLINSDPFEPLSFYGDNSISKRVWNYSFVTQILHVCSTTLHNNKNKQLINLNQLLLRFLSKTDFGMKKFRNDSKRFGQRIQTDLYIYLYCIRIYKLIMFCICVIICVNRIILCTLYMQIVIICRLNFKQYGIISFLSLTFFHIEEMRKDQIKYSSKRCSLFQLYKFVSVVWSICS